MIKKRQQRYLLQILRRRRKQTLHLYFTQATELRISVIMMPFRIREAPLQRFLSSCIHFFAPFRQLQSVRFFFGLFPHMSGDRFLRFLVLGATLLLRALTAYRRV